MFYPAALLLFFLAFEKRKKYGSKDAFPFFIQPLIIFCMEAVGNHLKFRLFSAAKMGQGRHQQKGLFPAVLHILFGQQHQHGRIVERFPYMV